MENPGRQGIHWEGGTAYLQSQYLGGRDRGFGASWLASLARTGELWVQQKWRIIKEDTQC